MFRSQSKQHSADFYTKQYVLRTRKKFNQLKLHTKFSDAPTTTPPFGYDPRHYCYVDVENAPCTETLSSVGGVVEPDLCWIPAKIRPVGNSGNSGEIRGKATPSVVMGDALSRD